MHLRPTLIDPREDAVLSGEDPSGVDQSSSTEEARDGLLLQSQKSHPGVLVDLGVLPPNHTDGFLHPAVCTRTIFRPADQFLLRSTS